MDGRKPIFVGFDAVGEQGLFDALGVADGGHVFAFETRDEFGVVSQHIGHVVAHLFFGHVGVAFIIAHLFGHVADGGFKEALADAKLQ